MSAINEFHENDISKRLEERKRKLQSLEVKTGKPTVPVLTAPVIEGLLADGTVPVDLFNQGLELLVPAWRRMDEGDAIFVYLDDNDTTFIASYVMDDPDETDFPIKLKLSERFFNLWTL